MILLRLFVCLFFFLQSNSEKQIVVLEIVGIICISSVPAFSVVTSIVYIVLHYEVLFKNK